MVENIDIFRELFKRIQKGASEKEILQEFGGSNIYIPSYKTILRDDDIFATYQKLQKTNSTQKRIMLTLAQQFNLSEQQLYKIIAEKNQPSQPRLFYGFKILKFAKILQKVTTI